MAKSSKELQDELKELIAEANALTMIADRDQGGEFTAEQQEDFNALMDDETGAIAKKKADYEARVKLETQKANLITHAQAAAAPNASPYAQATQQREEGKVSVINRGRNLVAFQGEDKERQAWLSGQWLRAMVAQSCNRHDQEAELRCAKNGIQIHSQANIGTDTAGGFLVPTPLSSAIINYREKSGVTRQLCRVMPMTANTLDVAKKTGTLTVEYPGEASAIGESIQTWAQVKLTAVKRAILSKVSQELNDDAIINVMDDLAQEMGSDLAINEDRELVNGDGLAGAGGVTGLIAALDAAGLAPATGTTWSTITLPDITAMMALLPSKFQDAETAFLCSPAFYDAVLLNLMATAGGNYIGSLVGGATGQDRPYGRIGYFLGYPVYMTNQMPNATGLSQTCLLFGDFRKAAMLGERIGINVAMSPDFAFNEDVLTIRATTRYDIQVHEGGDSAPGAYVGLATTAA